MAISSILCVTTDAEVLASLQGLAGEIGAELRAASSPGEALRDMGAGSYDAVLVQVDAPGDQVRQCLADGFLSSVSPPVVALSRNGSIRDAVRAMRAGACEYLPCPPRDTAVLMAVLERARHAADVAGHQAQDGPLTRLPLEGFVTADYQTLTVCQTLARVADSDACVWIEGESGTGKTLLARRLHERSSRADRPLVEVDCSALEEAAARGELFGNGPGRAPSAPEGDRPSRFELANGSTLLVKGIAKASSGLIGAIVAATQAGQVRRSGQLRPIRSDVRLVFAVNALPSGGAGFAVELPPGAVRVRIAPLRERVVDIPLLTQHFLRVFAAKHRRVIRGICADAMSRLAHYGWPGNVRELQNAVEYCVIVARVEVIRADGLPCYVRDGPTVCGTGMAEPVPLKDALRDPERRYILRALAAARGNKHYAAEKLQISRSTLYKKIKEYGLDHREPLHTFERVG
jgi:DNA-binding NtrC family response regulator